MNNQEIFNTVRDHLLAQSDQSANAGMCKYRGPRGLKCAIGCLIPDDKYKPYFEATGLPHSSEAVMTSIQLEILRALFVVGISSKSVPLLKSLQRVHDNCYANEWSQELNRVAIQYGVDP